MNKTTSDTLVKLRDKVVKEHGVTDWGVTYVDGYWIVGFLIKYKRYVGSGETPQEAYVAALHDINGSKAPPF